MIILPEILAIFIGFELLKEMDFRGDLEKINEEEEDDDLKYSESIESASALGRTRCRYSVTGCPFKLPSMIQHEDRECKYRPTRCPSLTCPVKPPFIKLLKHVTVSLI